MATSSVAGVKNSETEIKFKALLETYQVQSAAKLLEEAKPQSDPSASALEFEMKFKGVSNKTSSSSAIDKSVSLGHQPLNRIDYNNVVRKLAGLGYVMGSGENETGYEMLRVGYHNKEQELRVEISGNKNITHYCESNVLPEDAKVIHKKRSRANNVDFEDYACRATLSEEVPVVLTADDLVQLQDAKKNFRYINRVSLYPPKQVNQPKLRVDLSVVKMSSDHGATLLKDSNVFNESPGYEIEIEHEHDEPGTGADTGTARLLLGYKTIMSHILSGLQQSNFPISIREQNKVREEYLKVFSNLSGVQASGFVGPKSFSLDLEKLKLLTQSLYTVTEKADGERKLLYIDGSGMTYFITMGLDVQSTGAKTANAKLFNTILDGEHVQRLKKNESCNMYLMFDIYFCGGQKTFDLPLVVPTGMNPASLSSSPNSRVKWLQDIQVLLQLQPIKGTAKAKIPLVLAKTFLCPEDSTNFSAILGLSHTLLQQDNAGAFPYAIDGLIYTPASLGVGHNADGTVAHGNMHTGTTWKTCYKWKEEETVDFRVQLHATTVDATEQKLDLYYQKARQPVFYKTITMQKTEGGLVTDPTPSAQRIANNDIVEFKYNLQDDRWTPLKIRYDKLTPNGENVLNDMFKNKKSPVGRNVFEAGRLPIANEDMIPPDRGYKRGLQKQRNLLPNLREFHNRYVKSHLIKAAKEYATQTFLNSGGKITLIDFAAGQLNDIAKWDENKFAQVLAIDVDETSVKTNYQQNFYKNKTQTMRLDVLWGDSSKEIRMPPHDAFPNEMDKKFIAALVNTPSVPFYGFHVASIQFALHYMFESHQKLHGFLRNLQEMTAVNGLFIGTCFDGSKVNTYLGEDMKKELFDPTEQTTLLFSLERNYKPCAFDTMPGEETVGKKITVYMQSIGQSHAEYLVNFTYFTYLMKSYEFEPLSAEELKALKLPTDLSFKGMYKHMQQHDSMEKQYVMSREEQTISFLNRFFVFKKKKILNTKRLQQLETTMRELDEKQNTTAAMDTSADFKMVSASAKSSASANSSASAKRKTPTEPEFGPILPTAAKVRLVSIEKK
jgi:hypothetical protein